MPMPLSRCYTRLQYLQAFQGAAHLTVVPALELLSTMELFHLVSQVRAKSSLSLQRFSAPCPLGRSAMRPPLPCALLFRQRGVTPYIRSALFLRSLLALLCLALSRACC